MVLKNPAYCNTLLCYIQVSADADGTVHLVTTGSTYSLNWTAQPDELQLAYLKKYNDSGSTRVYSYAEEKQSNSSVVATGNIISLTFLSVQPIDAGNYSLQLVGGQAYNQMLFVWGQ